MSTTRLRLTKIDQYQLLTCMRHQVWGNQQNRFADWQVGDYLAFKVDNALAALAQVAGPRYTSKDQIWEDRLAPHRVPLNFVHYIAAKNRPPIEGTIGQALRKGNPSGLGLTILRQKLLPDESAKIIFDAISACPNALTDAQGNIDSLLSLARVQREAKVARKNRRLKETGKAQGILALDDNVAAATEQEKTAHSRYQRLLVQLGKDTGCDVWIAANDRNRQYKGTALGEGCMKQLPSMGLSDKAKQQISLIDIIWVRRNAPIYAFEVETTTQVSQGLQRMSDLMAVVPAINMKLFVVAPRQRHAKFVREIERPSLAHLSEYCRFLPGEDLETLAESAHPLAGYVIPSVIESRAVNLPSSLR